MQRIIVSASIVWAAIATCVAQILASIVQPSYHAPMNLQVLGSRQAGSRRHEWCPSKASHMSRLTALRLASSRGENPSPDPHLGWIVLSLARLRMRGTPPAVDGLWRTHVIACLARPRQLAGWSQRKLLTSRNGRLLSGIQRMTSRSIRWQQACTSRRDRIPSEEVVLSLSC